MQDWRQEKLLYIVDEINDDQLILQTGFGNITAIYYFVVVKLQCLWAISKNKFQLQWKKILLH